MDAIIHERRYIRQFINCDRNHVVYHIKCEDCNVSYIGCTTRKLKTRIQEQIRDSSSLNAHNPLSVSKHFFQCHNGNLSSLWVAGIERVNKPTRGDDWRRALLIQEAFWILHLNTSYPTGLNYRSDLILQY